MESIQVQPSISIQFLQKSFIEALPLPDIRSLQILCPLPHSIHKLVETSEVPVESNDAQGIWADK